MRPPVHMVLGGFEQMASGRSVVKSRLWRKAFLWHVVVHFRWCGRWRKAGSARVTVLHMTRTSCLCSLR